MTARPPVEAELISILDEKYVHNDIAYEAMHTAAALVFDGEGVRDSSGALDRTVLLAQFERLSREIPALRKRLVRVPLGLASPAWVPDEQFAIEHHVRFLDEPVELDGPGLELLTGRAFDPLSLSHAPWQFIVGDVAGTDARWVLIVRFQHVMGDALWAMEVLDKLLTEDTSTPVPDAAPARAPANSVALLGSVLGQWWTRQGSLGAALRDQRRKFSSRRIRRTGGRLLRPVRNSVIRRRGLREKMLPPRHSAYAVLDLATAVDHAKRHPCTVSDLVLASVLAALDDGSGTDSAIFMPVSKRTKGETAGRNQVGGARMSAPAGLTVDEIVPIVRLQVRAAISNKPVTVEPGAFEPAPTGPWSGYATYIPVGTKDRWMGPSRLELLIAWPAGDPGDDVACFATSYAGRLVITVTTRTTTDVEGLLARIVEGIEA